MHKQYIAEVFKADVPTFNGRIYTKECLEDINNYIKKQIALKTNLVGEYPPGDFMTFNTENVSHKIIDSYIENGSLFVKLEILSTPTGQTLTEMLESGLSLYACPRGVGNLENRNVYDYELLAVDIDTESIYEYPTFIDAIKSMEFQDGK